MLFCRQTVVMSRFVFELLFIGLIQCSFGSAMNIIGTPDNAVVNEDFTFTCSGSADNILINLNVDNLNYPVRSFTGANAGNGCSSTGAYNTSFRYSCSNDSNILTYNTTIPYGLVIEQMNNSKWSCENPFVPVTSAQFTLVLAGRTNQNPPKAKSCEQKKILGVFFGCTLTWKLMKIYFAIYVCVEHIDKKDPKKRFRLYSFVIMAGLIVDVLVLLIEYLKDCWGFHSVCKVGTIIGICFGVNIPVEFLFFLVLLNFVHRSIRHGVFDDIKWTLYLLGCYITCLLCFCLCCIKNVQATGNRDDDDGNDQNNDKTTFVNKDKTNSSDNVHVKYARDKKTVAIGKQDDRNGKNNDKTTFFNEDKTNSSDNVHVKHADVIFPLHFTMGEFVEWFNQKKEVISNGDKYQISEGTLLIKSVTEKDNGIYQAIVKTGPMKQRVNVVLHVTDRHSTQLNVNLKWFQITESELDSIWYSDTGEIPFIDDPVSNTDFSLSVSWTHNGNKTSSSFHKGNVSQLTVTKKTPLDEYHCEVTDLQNKKTQLFIFVLKFTGERYAQETTTHNNQVDVMDEVFGVPTILLSKGKTTTLPDIRGTSRHYNPPRDQEHMKMSVA